MRTLIEYGLANAAAATALAVVAVLVGLVVRRPAVRNALWVLVLVRLLLPPLWTVPLPVLGVGPAPSAVASVAPEPLPVGPHEPMADDALLARMADALGPIPPADPISVPDPISGARPVAAEVMPGQTDTSYRLPPETYAVVAAIWMLGSGFVLIRSAHRVIRFRRALQDAFPAPEMIQAQALRLARALGLRKCPTVLLVPGRVWPSLWMPGLFSRQARLILPMGLLPLLDPGQRAAVLAHELSRLRRGDPWVRWLEVVVCGIYWWHPLLGWFRRQLRESEEECCDLWVVAALGGRRSYATALVETVAYLGGPGQTPVPALASGAGPVRHLQRRVTMIMRATWPAGLTRLGLATVLGLGGLGLAFGPALAQQDKKERDDPPKERAKDRPDGDRPKDRPKDRPEGERPGKDRPEGGPKDRGPEGKDRGPGGKEVEEARAAVEKARREAREAMARLQVAEEKLAKAEGRPFRGFEGGPFRRPGAEGDRPGGDGRPGFPGPGGPDRPPVGRPGGDRPPGGEPMPPGGRGDLREMQMQIEELRKMLDQLRKDMQRGRGDGPPDRPVPKPDLPDRKGPGRPDPGPEAGAIR